METEGLGRVGPQYVLVSEQLKKRFVAQCRLFQYALEQGRRNIPRVHRDCNVKPRLGAVEQPCVTARLMMHIKTRPQQRANNLLRFENRQFLGHQIRQQ